MVSTLRAVCRAASVAMVLLMATMVVVINALVVTRYAFSYSAPWTEEITRYAMIWLVMLGAGVLTLFDDHIALNLVVDKLSRRVRPWQRLLVQLLVLGCALLIAWEGFPFAIGLRPVLATGLQVSMFYAAIAVPVGGVLIAVLALVRIAIEIAGIRGAKPPAIPDQFEFMDNSFKPVEDAAAAPSAHAHPHGAAR